MMQTTVLKPKRSSWNSRSWPRESTRVLILSLSLCLSLSRFLFTPYICLSRWHVTRLQDLGSRSRGPHVLLTKTRRYYFKLLFLASRFSPLSPLFSRVS